MFPGALTRIAVVAAVCAATVVNGTRPDGAAGTEKRPVPDPTVSGPIPGQPASLSAVDLGPRGYVEEEYFVEGTARAYEPAGPLTEDGRWNVQTTTTAPYRTRVLVRRPKDPAKFNGVVEVEWLNVSGGLDAAPDWGLGNAELLRGGFAWVGVSAQAVGVNSLKNSPARYGTLDHPGDAYSYDIYSQVGEALRRPTGTNLLGNRRYKIRTMIGDGESQSAFRMVTYVNAIQPQTGMFDGFFVHSRFAVGAPITDGGQNAIPNPTLIRPDTKKPVLVLESETDVPRHLPARQPDSARYRLWEVAGTAHFDEDGLHALTGIPKEEMVTTPPLGCAQRINSAPQRYIVNTAIHDLARWAGGGPPPPKAPPVTITEGPTPTIERDEHGNARGGIRLPQLEAPVATLSGEPGGGPGFCSLFGFTTAFDAARLSSLYPTHQDYVRAFSNATDTLRRNGFLLPADAKAAKAEASGSAVGG
ncbi:MAG TPA: alpha/beta hydrolase domain-containing protein [Acidimicrobiia bacterium]|nr:alpha/beta hydrolase domain-containing protein [Acidimicrobiia bacterium]